MLYKCALENDQHASCHSLDIGGRSTYTQVMHFGQYFSHKRWGYSRSTYMRVIVYTVWATVLQLSC